MLEQKELDLVVKMVDQCAQEQGDQVNGRRFIKDLMDFISVYQAPTYTLVTGLWVVLATLSEEWGGDHETQEQP